MTGDIRETSRVIPFHLKTCIWCQKQIELKHKQALESEGFQKRHYCETACFRTHRRYVRCRLAVPEHVTAELARRRADNRHDVPDFALRDQPITSTLMRHPGDVY